MKQCPPHYLIHWIVSHESIINCFVSINQYRICLIKVYSIRQRVLHFGIFHFLLRLLYTSVLKIAISTQTTEHLHFTSNSQHPPHNIIVPFLPNACSFLNLRTTFLFCHMNEIKVLPDSQESRQNFSLRYMWGKCKEFSSHNKSPFTNLHMPSRNFPLYGHMWWNTKSHDSVFEIHHLIFHSISLFSQHTQNHNSSIMQLGKDKAARLSFLQSMLILTSCAADSETNIVDSMRSIQNLLQFGIDNTHSSSTKSDSQHLPSHPTTICHTQPIGKFITIVYPPYTNQSVEIHHALRLRFWMTKWLSKRIHRTNWNKCTAGYGSLKVDLNSQIWFCTSPHRS